MEDAKQRFSEGGLGKAGRGTEQNVSTVDCERSDELSYSIPANGIDDDVERAIHGFAVVTAHHSVCP